MIVPLLNITCNTKKEKVLHLIFGLNADFGSWKQYGDCKINKNKHCPLIA
jgi:hypothetical protein